MKRYSIEFTPTKDFILSKVSQEQIMAYYLGIDIDLGVRFRSPLRSDKNPSCAFYYSTGGTLYLKDFSNGYRGDCFDIAMEIKNCGFGEVIKHISSDLSLIKTKVIPEELMERSGPRSRAILGFRKRSFWTDIDKDYWLSYGIHSRTLNRFHVFPMYMGFVNDEIVYRFKDTDPGYVYWVRKDEDLVHRMKFYFPLRDKDRTRFMGNCSVDDLFGYDNLPESGDTLVITKSLKDVMVFHELGIPAVGVQSETALISDDLMSKLRSRFRRIITLFDFDAAGIRLTNLFRKRFSTEFRFLTNGKFRTINYFAKDIADYIRSFGKENTLALCRVNVNNNPIFY